MKVLMLNGSRRDNGCTYTALCEIAKDLTAGGVEWEIMNVGSRVNKGEVNDVVNEAVEALKTTDAIIVGSPVYYASPSGEILMFLDRLFGKAEAELRFMPAATIASARRGGTTATLDVLNKYFMYNQMPLVASRYWNMVHGSAEAWKDALFSKSVFTDKSKVIRLTPEDLQELYSDPAYELQEAFTTWYYDMVRPVIDDTNAKIRLANRDYMRAQMAFEPDKPFYPDANLTLRVAYGHVEGYVPADGMEFEPVSTLKGIIEKDNPDIFDYNIPQALRDIYAAGGYEDQPVCFLATNHTSGGNSGSPVINADGNLIGINFDRVWEGTMSDIVFDPDVCRNISLDIRYLLFIVDKIGHASYLFDEMNFVD